ncbi:Domain of unknown function DUF1907 [Cinara cedri]|uniref:DUF1907 domain-containing protein n=1 Tax=Cinara cedri TaxID=506608 RepID=A0A5E4MCT3_9HEMI|nr:Domain of unknown function DUF1907 [Cinara cedri]
MTAAEILFPGTLHMNELSVVRVDLTAPPLSRIAEAILPELSKNFERASAEVVQCPNLTLSPFNLFSEGLSGDENVFDIGDLVNVVPAMKREKIYDMKDLKKIIASDPLHVIGPCAGPYPSIGVDSENVVRVKMTAAGDCIENRSKTFTMNESTGECVHVSMPDDETRFSLMANFFTCNGQTGKVLKIVCEVRKGPLSFTACVQEALAKSFGSEIIALGGVMFVEKGKAKVHVFKPNLAKKPLQSEQDFEKIMIHFIEVTPPSVGLGCIVSYDPGLNLRPHHFHMYTDHNNQGGHYHNDTEPETIKYTGYFSVAKNLFKVDQTHCDA